MLTTRTPMKRTGFKRKEPTSFDKPVTPGASVFDIERYATEREQRLAERAERAVASASPSPDNVTMAANDQMFAAPIEKEKPLRSEPYRRLVASLPCIYCGIAGYSQHAHENDGKGKGMKVDDRRAMALCCTRPGIEGCHVAFDQYRLLPGGREAHIEQGLIWAAETRKEIEQSSQWPKKLPLWKD